MSLKDYQIVSKLGSGSFGVVYKVKSKETGDICVIKEVELKSMDKRMREWAMNEVKIMKNINSQYIVKYFQSFVQKEKLYICMQYCSGGDLAQYLKGQMGKPLPEDTVWKFAIQIMLGLRDLHKQKILHRDIKTMNVFITTNKQIRIGDLGVARTLTGEFANTVVGTPYYLSPEMCEEKPYNEKTDVWAMGCLIYQLCTGKHPFEGNSQAALALKIVVGKYAPIPAHYSPVTSWLVKSCLSVDYKRRPTIQFILTQPDVIKMANKVGIPLESKPIAQSDKIEIKPKPDIVAKPIEKVEAKPYTPKNNQPKVIPKKNFYGQKQPQRKNNVDRSRQKSIDKSTGKTAQNKSGKKQVKNCIAGPPPPIPKGLPAKKSGGFQAKKPEPSAQLKKPDLKVKQPSPSQKRISVQKHSDKSYQSKRQPYPIHKITMTKAQQSQQKKQETMLLPIQTKPRKSVQQIVDDDELFKDFGITPEKLTVMHQKVEFKKVNTINWNINEQSQKAPFESKSSVFKQLPTIRTPSTCELVSIECKQIDADQHEVAEQIDDNEPYRSNESLPIDDQDEESLLVEGEKQIEQDSELKKRQKLLLLQKKIFENEKRKKQLIELKKQSQKQLLVKMDRQKFQRIIRIIKEGSDEDIEKIALKESNLAGGTGKFYKIFYWQIEMERCDETISRCKQNIKQLVQQK